MAKSRLDTYTPKYQSGWQMTNQDPVLDMQGRPVVDPNTGQPVMKAREQAVYRNATTGEEINPWDYDAKKKAEDEVMSNLAQGLNQDGSPVALEWQSLIDEATGKLKNQYQANISALDPAAWEGYQKYKGEAMRTGPSAWAGIQNQKQAAEEMATKEAAARQALGSQNQALGGLAMRGGLSTGSRMSLARSGARDLLASRQQAARQGTMNRLGIASTDEDNRLKQLAQLATSETDIGKFNKQLEGKQVEFNIGNLLRENEGKRAFDQSQYSEQMKKWAADRQARATERSSGGGGK